MFSFLLRCKSLNPTYCDRPFTHDSMPYSLILSANTTQRLRFTRITYSIISHTLDEVNRLNYEAMRQHMERKGITVLNIVRETTLHG
ncbi:hypothetical protein [Calothrix sp. UHCC 0171]|uniref:hypothetical protein n=1 Tax=Calothrix sp. UHCC 0171 TaxID=3110245 RepID=UPI002B201C0B|nr:hypothetical protein [Calothrix sp. UHCC 0171]MEA5573211.1 hypothetical protein [Calothrix sp. UHCC 0171]